MGEKLETLKSGMHRVNSNPNFQRLQTLIANSIAISPLDKDEIYKNIIRDLQSHFFPIAPSDKATLRELLAGHIEVDVECADSVSYTHLSAWYAPRIHKSPEER